jgi:uncharacterized protein YegL
MKENYTAIAVIADESGSMAALTKETINGFNSFLAEQKLVPGEASLTLVTFNSSHRTVHDFVKLADVPALTTNDYQPNGYTALLDAVGTTIDSLGARLEAMPEEERPSKVILLIMTDGEENSSKKFAKDKIKEMISHQQEKYNWIVTFMGANIDAFGEAASMGIVRGNVLSYVPDANGTKDLYGSMSGGVSRARMSSSIGVSQRNFFQDDDAKDQK